ncbi:MAG: DNA-3-methyladenine glycosylase [Spirochaetaceae bacterium]|jgi:N-glycosylase/DNA lyase|nr:DNA-3-methyladenine glycosylase [Spirochaetaceae bacterium]
METTERTFFDPDLTLNCGQCFRWDKGPDGVWTGVVGKKVLRVAPGDLPSLYANPEYVRYFDLERDYAPIYDRLCLLSPEMEAAAVFSAGIRILNQDPWEALCSFIISQNNNIPRIKGIIRRLSDALGDAIEGGQSSFPGPERLADAREEVLRTLGCGFRAPYIIDAARKVAGGDIVPEALRDIPVNEARRILMSIRGVGPKVADCALLYGLHRLDVFPSDVWIKRALETLFPGKTAEFFGEYAGIAQQYIFHYMRCGRRG